MKTFDVGVLTFAKNLERPAELVTDLVLKDVTITIQLMCWYWQIGDEELETTEDGKTYILAWIARRREFSAIAETRHV